MHPEVHPWIILPFGLLLGGIAVMPLLARHWWEQHYPKVTLALIVPTLAYYAFILKAHDRIFESVHEYISFICLIGSLFVVSGGIHIRVKGEATPFINVLILAIGAVISNVIGTTGASMVLIRPYLRANKYRITAFHIVFFIFIVSNVGGLLTPVGDPPLYMGYLKGVPFFWTLGLWPMWLIALSWLLAIFYILDRQNFLRAPKQVREKETAHEEWKFEGLMNLMWLAIILSALFVQKPNFLREILMVGAAAGSWFLTKREIHESNKFTWAPIKEVAILFVGIFITMMPALDWLSRHASELGIRTSASFYWSCGVLSSVLDNAPTYLNFLTLAIGLQPADVPTAQVLNLAQNSSSPLAAISVAAVFFGACTYIGNGPNFMVQSIAQHAGVKTPSFFGYILKFALPVLLPILTLIWLFFFRT